MRTEVEAMSVDARPVATAAYDDVDEKLVKATEALKALLSMDYLEAMAEYYTPGEDYYNFTGLVHHLAEQLYQGEHQ